MLTRSSAPGRDRAVTSAPWLVTHREVDPATYAVPGPDSGVWDAAPWLDELREVPPEAVWPRLMTLPHPRATGTYGPEVLEVHAATTGGGRMRWWQRLSVYRILEHDADGLLVWAEFLESTARQLGKSYTLRDLAWWRTLKAPGRWGDQLTLHTGRELGVVREILLPAWTWAEQHGLEANRNNLNPGISTEPHSAGSRWVIRAKSAAYGLAPGLALVDEGWDVPAVTVDEAIEPTLVEQTAHQLGIFSTAHRKATGLMIERRAAAIAEIERPDARLLLEWSPPATLDRTDPRAWRAASPHWSASRERLVRKALEKVLRGESVDPTEPDPIASFDAQWLNRWPNTAKVEQKRADEPLVDPDRWSECRDPDAGPGPAALVVLAVEDDLGAGAAAVAAALAPDGRVVVGGHRFGSRREAIDWCEDTADGGDEAILLAGASMVDDAELEGLDVPLEAAGRAETAVGLSLVRELVRLGHVAYCDDPDGPPVLERAVRDARVRPGQAGSLILTPPDALVRCFTWAIGRAHRDRA